MSRTVPTYSEIVKEELRKWKKFRTGLRRRKKETFDKIMDYARLNRPAGSQMVNPNPFQPMILFKMDKILVVKAIFYNCRRNIDEERRYLLSYDRCPR